MSNINVYSGSTKSVVFTVTDGDGTAVDITGATITFEAVNRRTKASAISLSVGSGITITGATSGQFTVTLSTSNTSNNPGSWYYEATVTVSGETTVVSTGLLEILEGPAG